MPEATLIISKITRTLAQIMTLILRLSPTSSVIPPALACRATPTQTTQHCGMHPQGEFKPPPPQASENYVCLVADGPN